VGPYRDQALEVDSTMEGVATSRGDALRSMVFD